METKPLFDERGAFGSAIKAALGAPGFVDIHIGGQVACLTIDQAHRMGAALSAAQSPVPVEPEGLKKPGKALE